ncbi:venom acid phosphatase Acph-1-like [Euwallacea fornicatus]|uniref:venom acid phosphatase Acph-1-like n=1 Tax=Euwallacea fornicatus TaxID=995702 RepID=UPI00338EB507
MFFLKTAIGLLMAVGGAVALPTRAFYANESTLQLVHLVFRHGDRNPEDTNLYPSNPYYEELNYYPYGYGQLTNVGKRREYDIGTTLRKRYFHFLGNVLNMSVLEVRSTDYDRTKMSANLFTAGLWPPRCLNTWHPVLHWQPFPYNYELIINDKELSPWNSCDRFNDLVEEVLETPEIEEYLTDRYNETRTILANRTGLEISYLKAFLLYFGFYIQEELNLPLEDWVQSIYPEPLHSLVVDYYYLQTNNTELRKIISGYLLKKIIFDTKNHLDGKNPQGRKMYIYSGHETNIAPFLLSLGVFQVTDVPPYGSYILLEIHKIDNVYGVKIFYEDYKGEELHTLKLPSCDEFCPLDDFFSLTEDLLPASDEECHGSNRKS